MAGEWEVTYPALARSPCEVRLLAEVNFEVPGFHRWPDAPESRAYLRTTHRHVFKVKVRIYLSGDDRELEFHDLLDAAKTAMPHMTQQTTLSCERAARLLHQHLTVVYPRRGIEVSVSEDGECAGIVTTL